MKLDPVIVWDGVIETNTKNREFKMIGALSDQTTRVVATCSPSPCGYGISIHNKHQPLWGFGVSSTGYVTSWDDIRQQLVWEMWPIASLAPHVNIENSNELLIQKESSGNLSVWINREKYRMIESLVCEDLCQIGIWGIGGTIEVLSAEAWH